MIKVGRNQKRGGRTGRESAEAQMGTGEALFSAERDIL